MRFALFCFVAALFFASFARHAIPVQEGGTVPKVIVVEGRREPGEASVSTKAMRYLPFEVPEGVTRITIHKDLTHGLDATLKNTVDLGLFDSRGYGPGGPGFRGWQGGASNDLVITGDYATSSPHGIPGPIQPGRWHIAQYFLKSTPAGLGYKYTITLAFDGPKPPNRFPEIPKYEPGIVRSGQDWYAGNLHAHSVHSDGRRTFTELVARNEAMGFDFLVSTEHNSPTAHYRFVDTAKAHPRHLLIHGNEFTSPSGHANILGQKPDRFFDFRLDAGDGRLRDIIREAHKQGALFVVNHPFALCTSCTWKYPREEWLSEDAAVDAIEVWNGAWTFEDRAAVDLWDKLLKEGRRIHAFGGTDYHRAEEPMTPAAFVRADSLSTKAILDGLRQGRVTLSEMPKGPKVFLTSADGRAVVGDTLWVKSGEAVEIQVRVVGGKGMSLRLVRADGETVLPITEDEVTLRHKVRLGGERSYVRAELQRGEGGAVVALTNPLYLGAWESHK
jgi:hypothetical protein